MQAQFASHPHTYSIPTRSTVNVVRQTNRRIVLHQAFRKECRKLNTNSSFYIRPNERD